jgi:hypothetical protein
MPISRDKIQKHKSVLLKKALGFSRKTNKKEESVEAITCCLQLLIICKNCPALNQKIDT